MTFAASLPAWEVHPDVLLVIGGLVVAYALAITRLGPRYAPPGRPAVTRLQLVSFATGAALLLVVSVWPIHDVAESRLFSVHMVQHLSEMFVAPPLLLLGTPAWMARLVVRPGVILTIVRFLARFIPATILFTGVLVFAHLPGVMDAQIRSGAVHFLVHSVAVVAALVAWMVVVSPLPEVPRLAPPLRMLWLFVQGIVPTVPASFLTFGQKPLYPIYEEFPRMWGLSPLEDMQLGGLIMKVLGGIVLWGVVAVIFFRWFAEEEDRHVPPGVSRDIDRELAQMGLAKQ